MPTIGIQCRAEVAASVELNGSTGYYLSLSEALALARTDAYRGCTLTILRSSTDPISVNSGSFTLTAAQGVMLGGKGDAGQAMPPSPSPAAATPTPPASSGPTASKAAPSTVPWPWDGSSVSSGELPRRRHHLRHRHRHRRYLHR